MHMGDEDEELIGQKWKRVFKDKSRRISGCKPGDRNIGGVRRAVRKRASVSGKKEKELGDSLDRKRFRNTGVEEI